MSENKTAVIIDADGLGRESAFESACLNGKITVLGGADRKQNLFVADYLVLIASDSRSLEDKDVCEDYTYFLDEIKWKRKASGEVIILDASEVSFSPSRLSYALKKCRRFRIDKSDEAVDYMIGTAPEPNVPIAPVPAPNKPRPSNVCKDDHVFGEEKQKKETFAKRTETERKPSQQREAKTYERKDASENPFEGYGKSSSYDSDNKGRSIDSDPFEGYSDNDKKQNESEITIPPSMKKILKIIGIIMIIGLIFSWCDEISCFGCSGKSCGLDSVDLSPVPQITVSARENPTNWHKSK